MDRVIVDIHISEQEYLRWYTGDAQYVFCTARDGRRVKFPASILRRFVTRDGINGSFQIQFSAKGKLQQIEQLV